MVRVLILIFGFAALIAGAACTASGVASLRTLDEDDYILSGPARLTTSASGFVGSTKEVVGRDSGLRRGAVTVRIRVVEGGSIFLGIAPRDAADAYLGAARREILDQLRYDPLEVRRTAAGAGALPGPPASALTWTVSAAGDAPFDLTWEAENGDFVFAILRQDGSPGVDVTLEFGTKFRNQRSFAIAGIAIGMVVVVLGFLFLFVALRRRVTPSPAA